MRPFTESLVILVILCHAAAPALAQADRARDPNAAAQLVAADSTARRELADLRTVPGVRFELRYATIHNFTGAILPGYGAAIPLLRREAAAALGSVQRALATRGLGLKVWDAYRPVRATLAMVAWCERVHRTDLLDDGYIARHSRHNQGVAIDLTVVSLRTGRELAMGTGFDEFSARAHTVNATGLAAANRKLLDDAMRRAGFTNYVDEWWHYTFDVPDPVPFDLPLMP